jgi:hypothetical protein
VKKPSTLLVKKKTTIGALLNDKEKKLKENTIAASTKTRKNNLKAQSSHLELMTFGIEATHPPCQC